MEHNTIREINNFIFWYFVVISLCYLVLLFASIPSIIRHFKEEVFGKKTDLMSKGDLLPVTVLVPAYNEEVNILNCLKSILNSKYKALNVVVINDSSTDKTLEILLNEYDLVSKGNIIQKEVKSSAIKQIYGSKKHPNLTVIDKVHSGKSDSLNVGVNATQTPYFITIDADTIIEPNAISELVYVALNEPDVVAVGGAVYLLNNCKVKEGEVVQPRLPKHYIDMLQVPEYIRSFLFNRTGWNCFKGGMCLSGTATMLDKKTVVGMGGFDLGNPAQDAEIIINMHRYMRSKKQPYKIIFTPSSFVWTDAPVTLKEIWKQRMAWQRGLLRSVFLHFNLFFNPRYGIIGLFNYPFFLFAEVFGSFIEFTAYLSIFISYFFGILDVKSAFLFVILSWGFVSFLTMATVLLNFITFNKYGRFSDGVKLFFAVFFETFGFRQVLTVCRVWATVKYVANRTIDLIFKRKRVFS